MAYDDVWFDGFTKNPWNIAEGSSGSSAGPAAAVAAGLVPFALGTETGGSITYPANTCGVTAHRSSFGLVGRSNIMSLAESLVSRCQGPLSLCPPPPPPGLEQLHMLLVQLQEGCERVRCIIVYCTDSIYQSVACMCHDVLQHVLARGRSFVSLSVVTNVHE